MSLSIIDRQSPNYDARTRSIDLIVLHYTGMQDAETALRRLTDEAPVAGAYPGPWQLGAADPTGPLPRVSAHYVVDEKGAIHRLVSEENRAWHAGASSWQGEGDVNSRSIGIEIVNGGHDFGLPDFPDAQIESVIALVGDIQSRWMLAPSRVVAHSDIAPDRKVDPGEKFPWKRLAEAGVSIWPNSGVAVADPADPIVALQERLAGIGYDVKASGQIDAATKAAIAAFQRRFRPSKVDGVADAETERLATALSLQLRNVS